jgi:hypothetical protein
VDRICVSKANTGLIAKAVFARRIAVNFTVAGGVDTEKRQRVLDAEPVSEVIWDVDAVVEPARLVLPYDHIFGRILMVGRWVKRYLEGSFCWEETERYSELIEPCEEARGTLGYLMIKTASLCWLEESS